MPGIVTTETSAFIARWHVKPEKRAEFMAVFDQLWRGALDLLNAQCKLVFYGWDRDDRVFFNIESYKDEGMLDALRQSDVFQDTVSKLLSLCDSPMELQLLRGMESDKSVFEKYPAGDSEVHPTAGAMKVVIS